ncbi:MAG: hypothetical protein MK212_17845 [Saprospiraceae bacterium]|nr:hypothetical protein [Saprospiraceae bacterium]
MLKFFNFKKPERRNFGYQPRFYDEKKEALNHRINASKEDPKGIGAKSRISLQFKEHRERERHGRKVKSFFKAASSIRLLIILIVLTVGAYYILTMYLPQLLNYWFPE